MVTTVLSISWIRDRKDTAAETGGPFPLEVIDH